MKTRHSILSLALSLALAAPLAHGMGLGQMQVKSGLNQPLVAEIPIISATQSELDKLEVRLAPPEAFARVGLDEPADLTANLQFSVGKNARGQPVIRITTSSRFAEPILSFLIEADWGRGTVTREYTALIDPPYIAPAVVTPMQTPTMVSAPPPAPVVAPVVQPTPTPPEPTQAQTQPATEPTPAQVLPPPPEPVVMAPPPAPEPAPEAAAPAPTPPPPAPVAVKPAPRVLPPPPAPVVAPPPPPAPSPANNGQYGPVAAGQTLWSIANSVRSDSALSVNQMMLAILRSNPEAFDQDNINRLKSGSVLRIPDHDEVSRLSPEQAAALVHEQAAAWRSPRAPVPQPAEVAGNEPPQVKPPKHQPAPASSETPEVAKPPAVASAAKPSKPRRTHLEIVPPAGKSSARSVESGAAAGAGGTELRAQLTQAREDLAASKAESAELRSRVSDLEKQQADRQRLIDLQSSQLKELQDRLHQLESEKTAAAAAPVPQPVPAPASSASSATASAPVVTAPAPSMPTPVKPAEKPPVAPESAPAAEPEAAPWYTSYYAMGGGALVLIAGLVFVLRRLTRKSENGDAPSRRISEDDALRASLAATRKKPATPAEEASPAPAAAAVDKEAQTLAAAVRNKPQDLEAHLSLLRYYHSHGDAVAYESAAQAMRMQVASTTDPRWREAVVLGAALLPGHPLFSQAGWNAPRFNETETPARGMESLPPAEEKRAPAAPAPAAAAAKAVSVTEASDEEWNRAMGKPATPPPTVATPAVAPAAKPALAPAPAIPAPAPAPVPEPEPEMSFSAPAEMDIHRSEAEVLAEDEASATRIELAKAYLDIGDLEGARSMLEEVMADGGPAAKSVAERILKEIG